MTGWLEYFTEALNAQMREVQMAAEYVIRRDVIATGVNGTSRCSELCNHEKRDVGIPR